MSEKTKDTLVLALLVAVLPPLWAVASPHFGENVGAIALICAGVYGAAGNDFSIAHKTALGFLAGDIWALLVGWVTSVSKINADLTLFITLFVLGFLVVVISNALPNMFYMPAWLSGWAIGMVSMGLDTVTPRLNLAVQVGVAMLVGVYYVGALQTKIFKIIRKKDK